MENKHQVHNLVILDESGSMESIRKATIDGFNELLQNAKGIEKQFPDQEHIMSFFSFNGCGIKTLHFFDPISKIDEINARSYSPNSLTPLLDAIGYACNKLDYILQGQDNQNYNVLVTILTDGEENDSKEYSTKNISDLIERLKEAKWTFTYIGTDHDITKVANSLHIDHIMSFNKDPESMRKAFNIEKQSRAMYCTAISNHAHISNYYQIDDESELKEDNK